jgi:quercetin dioxygenase-like cupin family protein
MTAVERLEQIEAREIVPGFTGRFVHSESMTFAYWSITKDASLPAHSHPHEQVVNMLEGEFELTVEGVAHRLSSGDVLAIPRIGRTSGTAVWLRQFG